jgi:hypothetical protein
MTSAKSAGSQDSATTNGNSSTRSTSSAPKDQARDVAANVRGAAETVASRLPEAAAQTRAAVDEAARRIETGSDEMLTAGTSLSLGLAIGMLIGGAPRILVALALVPAAAMGLTILDRSSRAAGRRSI